jgi:hypothetical protein
MGRAVIYPHGWHAELRGNPRESFFERRMRPGGLMLFSSLLV